MDFRRPELSFSTHGYELVSYYGGGMYGRAYLVRKIDSEELRIAKTVDLTEMVSASREAAIQEANLLLGFTHRNIVPCYEAYVQDDSYLVMIMEYCQGGDLSRVLNVMRVANQYFTEEEVKSMLRQLLSALAFIHENRILHRDLKPSNILISKTGELKVADFGVARVLTGATCAALTSAGTPNYMAPEMCKRKPYSFYSDMWSLGCVLYEIMTLTTAFQGESIIALAWSVCFENPSPIRGRFSSTLEKILMMLLSKEPDRRLLPCALLHHEYFLQALPSLVASPSHDQEEDELDAEAKLDHVESTIIGGATGILESVPEEDDAVGVDAQVLLTKLLFSMWIQQVPPLVCIVTSNPAWPNVIKERITLPLLIKAGFRSYPAQILMDIIREEKGNVNDGVSSPSRRMSCLGSPISNSADAAAEEAINNLIGSSLDAAWADRLGQALHITFATTEFVALMQFLERMTNNKYRTLKDLLPLHHLNTSLGGPASFTELLETVCSEYLDKNELIVRLRWAVNEILKDNNKDHMTAEGTTNAIAELASGESNVIDKEHFLRIMGIRFALYSNAPACAKEMYVIANKDQNGSVNWGSTVEFLLAFARYDGDPEKNQERDINKALVASQPNPDPYGSSAEDLDSSLVTTYVETTNNISQRSNSADIRPQSISRAPHENARARHLSDISNDSESKLLKKEGFSSLRYQYSNSLGRTNNSDMILTHSPSSNLSRQETNARVEQKFVATVPFQSAVDESYWRTLPKKSAHSVMQSVEPSNSRQIPSQADDGITTMRVTRSLQRSEHNFGTMDYREMMNEDPTLPVYRQSFDLTVSESSNILRNKSTTRYTNRRGTDARSDMCLYPQLSAQQDIGARSHHLRNLPIDMEISHSNPRLSRLEMTKLPNTPEDPDDNSSASPKSYNSDEISLRRIKSTQGTGNACRKQKLCLRSFAVSDDRSNSSDSMSWEVSSTNWYNGRPNGRASPGGRQNHMMLAMNRRAYASMLRCVNNKEMRKLTYWEGYPTPYQIVFDVPTHVKPFETEERISAPPLITSAGSVIMELVSVGETFLGHLRKLLLPRQHDDIDMNMRKEQLTEKLLLIQRRIRLMPVNKEKSKLLKAQEQIRSISNARAMSIESIMICTRVLIAVICDIMDGSLADVLSPSVRELILGQYTHRQKLFQQIFSGHSQNAALQVLFQILSPSVPLLQLLEGESEDSSSNSGSTDDMAFLDLSMSHRDSFELDNSWLTNAEVYNAARRAKTGVVQSREKRLVTSAKTPSECNNQQPGIIVDDNYPRRLTHVPNMDMASAYGQKRRSNIEPTYTTRAIQSTVGRRSSISTDVIVPSVLDNEPMPSRMSSARYRRFV